MYKALKIVLITVLFLIPQMATSQVDTKDHIAIYSFDKSGDVSEDDILIVVEAIRHELIESKQFRVLGRDKMDEIMKEQNFHMSGICDESNCDVEIGKILSVEKIIGGSLRKSGDLYVLSARIYDVESGEILKSVRETLEGTINQLLTITVKLVSMSLIGDKNEALFTKTKSQDSQFELAEAMERKRLIIFPSEYSDNKPNSVEEEITHYVSSLAENLGKYEVIDHSEIKTIMKEKRLQFSGIVNESKIVEIGNIIDADQALKIDIFTFSQIGVPLDKNKDEMDPNNIQTKLSLSFKEVNLKTGKVLQSTTLNVEHTGGNLSESWEKTFDKFKLAALINLENFYFLTMGITKLDDGRIFIPMGYDDGVKKGTMFEIVRPGKALEVNGEFFKSDEKRLGFLEADQILNEANFARRVKVWEPLKTGDKAIRIDRPMYGGTLSYSQLSSGAFGINIGWELFPLSKIRGWASFGYRNGMDSQDERLDGFGLDIGPNIRMYNGKYITFSVKGGLGVMDFFKNDSADIQVSNTSFRSIIGLSMEYYRSATQDITIFLGYISHYSSKNWTKSDDADGVPKYKVVWDGEAPEINISGFFLTVGYKLTFFGLGIK